MVKISWTQMCDWLQHINIHKSNFSLCKDCRKDLNKSGLHHREIEKNNRRVITFWSDCPGEQGFLLSRFNETHNWYVIICLIINWEKSIIPIIFHKESLNYISHFPCVVVTEHRLLQNQQLSAIKSWKNFTLKALHSNGWQHASWIMWSPESCAVWIPIQ